jgi:hypothetical protein
LAETARSAEEARAKASASAAAAQAAGAQQNATVPGEDTFTAFAKAVSQAAPTIRAKIAQQLKDAGIYRGKVSSEFNNRFYNALLEAEKRRAELARIIDVPDRFDFIAGLAEEGKTEGEDGPTVFESVQVSTPEETRAIIDTVVQDQLGRKATDAELKRYTKMIRKLQKTSPTVTTVTTSGKVQRRTTTGGFNAKEYLLDEISGTDEAKANQVLSFYETFMKALGQD